MCQSVFSLFFLSTAKRETEASKGRLLRMRVGAVKGNFAGIPVIRQTGQEKRYCSAFGRTVTASGHSNRFAMGRMLPSCTFLYGLRSKCADLSEQ